MGAFVSDSSLGMTERLFAWSFMVAVASGLRWDDLINTAPTTTVLMKEGLIGCAAKTKTRGKSDGRPWVAIFLFPTKSGSHMGLYSSDVAREIPRVISGYVNLWFRNPNWDSTTKPLRFGLVQTNDVYIIISRRTSGRSRNRASQSKSDNNRCTNGGNLQRKGEPGSTSSPRKL